MLRFGLVIGALMGRLIGPLVGLLMCLAIGPPSAQSIGLFPAG